MSISLQFKPWKTWNKVYCLKGSEFTRFWLYNCWYSSDALKFFMDITYIWATPHIVAKYWFIEWFIYALGHISYDNNLAKIFRNMHIYSNNEMSAREVFGWPVFISFFMNIWFWNLLMCLSLQLPIVVFHSNGIYEGRLFTCGTGVLQGALWDLSIFHSLQPIKIQFLVLKYWLWIQIN